MAFVYAWIVPSWADQLEQCDTLPIQCRHTEHNMHEGVWFNVFFLQNGSCENLDNFSLIRLLYMHRWCLHGPINSYHSFWWSNLILCLYNIDTLNICMKESGEEKKLTKWQLWEFWWRVLWGLIQWNYFEFGPVVQMSFKRFLIWSSGGPCSGVGPLMQIWLRALWGTFMWSYLKFGPVVQEMLFNEKSQ